MRYDVVVVGLGCCGSAALHFLADHPRGRGLRICGIDGSGSEPGSYFGTTRITRRGPFLREELYRLWDESMDLLLEYESRRGKRFFFKTGLLQIGEIDAEIRPPSEIRPAPTSLASAFWFDTHERVSYLDEAGYVLSEALVEDMKATASEKGATILKGSVDRILPEDDRFILEVGDTSISAEKVIVTTGSNVRFLRELMGDLALRSSGLHRLPRAFHFLSIPAGLVSRFQPDRFPVFRIIGEGQHAYGLPIVDGVMKVSESSYPGDPSHALFDPADEVGGDQVHRYAQESLGRVVDVLKERVRGLRFTHRDSGSCIYTLTADGIPILFGLDRDLQFARCSHARLLALSGGSGQLFKFGPGIGRQLADWAVGDRQIWMSELFGLGRFMKSTLQF